MDQQPPARALPVRPGETFIGDGLYLSFDGWYVWLRTPRAEGNHLVALERQTWIILKSYADRHLCDDCGEDEGEGAA